MNPKKFQLCILGSASYDQYFTLPNFPQPGETIQAKTSFYKNGGKGANCAVAAARLQSKACFAGQFGTIPEQLTNNLINEMKSAGLFMEFSKQLQEIQTGKYYFFYLLNFLGQALIMLLENGENQIIIVGGANTHYDNLSILPQYYQDAILDSKILLLQKEIPIEINMLAAKFAQENKCCVALDCGGRDEIISKEFTVNLNFISPNETELQRLIGEVNEQTLSAQYLRTQLLKDFPNLQILIKLGEKGCKFVNTNLELTMQIVSEINPKILNDYKIIDTTGAGDCFTAAFFVRYVELTETLDVTQLSQEEYKNIILRCMFFGNCCGFLCITVIGAMPSMPNRSQVNEFIEKYFSDFEFK